MNEPTTLGAYLRRERERRGLALRTISESTKVSAALLEGLEADDISRWPGGIFRRAFVRSYAQCVGLEPDDVVRRFERQYQPDETELPIASGPAVPSTPFARIAAAPLPPSPPPAPQRARVLGTVADLTVALVLAFGSAAAGSRLLWPVLLIAAYYAIGILLTGTSPMVSLLSDQSEQPADRLPVPAAGPVSSAAAPAPAAELLAPPPHLDRRPQVRRTNERPRQRRGAPARA